MVVGLGGQSIVGGVGVVILNTAIRSRAVHVALSQMLDLKVLQLLLKD